MEAVAQKTGRNIIVEEGTESVLTVDFGFMPFEEALLQLLKGKNYALLRSNDGTRIATVRVLANPEAGEPTSHPTKQPNQPPKALTLPPLPLQALGEVSQEQVNSLLKMLKQHEAATGEDMREKLKELRAAVDPNFDPDTDGEELTDEELVRSVLKLALGVLKEVNPSQ